MEKKGCCKKKKQKNQNSKTNQQSESNQRGCCSGHHHHHPHSHHHHHSHNTPKKSATNNISQEKTCQKTSPEPKTTPPNLQNIFLLEPDNKVDQSYHYLMTHQEDLNKSVSVFKITFFESVFGNQQNWRDKLKTKFNGHHFTQTGICGKLIKPGEIAYRCFTCEMDYTCFICADCFEAGNHENHHFEIVRNPEKVMCDCGDHEAWMNQGFCKHHTGFLRNLNLNEFSLGDRMKMTTGLHKAVYYIFQGLETSQTRQERLYFSFLMQALIEALTLIIDTEKHMSVILGEAMTQKLNENFKNGIRVLHNCQNFSGKEVFLSHDCVNTKCECTCLQLVIRCNRLLYSPNMDRESGGQGFGVNTQLELIKLFIKLFNSYEFKQKFAVEYFRMIWFTVNWQLLGKPNTDNLVLSELFKLFLQVMGSEKLADLAVKEVGIGHLVEGIRDAIDYFEDAGGKIVLGNVFNYKILYLLRWILMKRRCIVRVLSSEESVEGLLQIFVKIYLKKFEFVYNLKKAANLQVDNHVKNLVVFELNCYGIFNEIFSYLVSGMPSQTERPFLRFMKQLQSCILEVNRKLESRRHHFERRSKSSKVARSINLPLEKLYISGLVSYLFFEIDKDKEINLVEFSMKKYKNLNEELFTDKTSRIQFWRVLTQAFGGCMGFLRETSNAIWGFYGPVTKKINKIYYKLLCHKYDVVGLQFCMINLEKEFYSIFQQAYFQNSHLGISIKKKGLVTTTQSNQFPYSESEISTFFSDFFACCNELILNQTDILFIIDQFIQKIKKQKVKLPVKSLNLEAFSVAKQSRVLTTFASLPPLKVSQTIKILKGDVADIKVIHKVLERSGSLTGNYMGISKDRLTELTDEYKTRLRNFDIKGRPYFTNSWFNSQIYSMMIPNISQRLGGEVDYLRYLPSETEFNRKLRVVFEKSSFLKECVIPLLTDMNLVKLLKEKIHPLLKLLLIGVEVKEDEHQELLIEQIQTFLDSVKDYKEENHDLNSEDFKVIEIFMNKMERLSYEINIANGEGFEIEGEVLGLREKRKQDEKKKKILAEKELEQKKRRKRKKKARSRLKNKANKFLQMVEDQTQKIDEDKKNTGNSSQRMLQTDPNQRGSEETTPHLQDPVTKKPEPHADGGHSEHSYSCIYCSKEIPAKEVHYLLGKIHASNLYEETMSSALTETLKENSSEMSQDQYQRIFLMKDEIVKSGHLGKNFFVSNCMHRAHVDCYHKLSHNNMRVFDMGEKMCPYCKNPSNLGLFVIPGYELEPKGFRTNKTGPRAGLNQSLFKDNQSKPIYRQVGPQEFLSNLLSQEANPSFQNQTRMTLTNNSLFNSPPGAQEEQTLRKAIQNLQPFLSRFSEEIFHFKNLLSMHKRDFSQRRRAHHRFQALDLLDLTLYFLKLSGNYTIEKLVDCHLLTYKEILKYTRLIILGATDFGASQSHYLSEFNRFKSELKADIRSQLTQFTQLLASRDPGVLNVDVGDLIRKIFCFLVASCIDDSILVQCLYHSLKLGFELKVIQVDFLVSKLEMEDENRFRDDQDKAIFRNKALYGYLIQAFCIRMMVSYSSSLEKIKRSEFRDIFYYKNEENFDQLSWILVNFLEFKSSRNRLSAQPRSELVDEVNKLLNEDFGVFEFFPEMEKTTLNVGEDWDPDSIDNSFGAQRDNYLNNQVVLEPRATSSLAHTEPRSSHLLWNAAKLDNPKQQELLFSKNTRRESGRMELRLSLTNPEYIALTLLRRSATRFKFKPIPEDFKTMYHTVTKKECMMCLKKPKVKDFAYCMLCGAVICVGFCSSDHGHHNHQERAYFNLCSHSLHHHNGRSVYINIMKGSYILYDITRFFEFDGLYTDKFGMMYHQYATREVSMDSIKLNHQVLKEIEKAYRGHGFLNKIIQANLTEKVVMRRGTL